MDMKIKRFMNYHISKINYIEYEEGKNIIGSSEKGIEKIVLKALLRCDSFFFIKTNVNNEIKIELELKFDDTIKEYLIYCKN